MSLDVTVRYKKPVMENYGETHGCCGSTAKAGPYSDEKVSKWSANITHNMCEMARHIPVDYSLNGERYMTTLYQMVWYPEEVWDGISCCNTDVMEQVLRSGIAYMVLHREELEVYNPANGWGSYNAFYRWLNAYWETCLRHPGCKVEVSR